MKLTDYLGDKPFWRVTVKLAVPVALQNVLTSSFQLVDTLMVSQLGDVTLSAVGMAAQWGWLCGLLGFGLCSGMSVFISQYWGVKDLKGIRRVMGIGLMLAMFVSLGFLAVALAAPTWVLGLFNQDPAVVETGCRYLRIVCFSYPAVALTYLLSNVLRGTERVRLPLYVSIVTTIANAFADYGLIFGAFGLPRLGVEGAAIATCISSWLGPVLILIFSAFEKNLLVGPVRELLDFNLKQLGEFCARALPVMSGSSSWNARGSGNASGSSCAPTRSRRRCPSACITGRPASCCPCASIRRRNCRSSCGMRSFISPAATRRRSYF